MTNDVGWDEATLGRFEQTIARMLQGGRWTKAELVDLFNQTLVRFSHKETFKYLDDRM